MPHSFSLAASMNLEHSIKEGSHERYPVHLQCLRNIKKIKYPDFQAMTLSYRSKYCILVRLLQRMFFFPSMYSNVILLQIAWHSIVQLLTLLFLVIPSMNLARGL